MPTSKQAEIVARPSRSFTSRLLMPEIGQHPKATQASRPCYQVGLDFGRMVDLGWVMWGLLPCAERSRAF